MQPVSPQEDPSRAQRPGLRDWLIAGAAMLSLALLIGVSWWRARLAAQSAPSVEPRIAVVTVRPNASVELRLDGASTTTYVIPPRSDGSSDWDAFASVAARAKQSFPKVSRFRLEIDSSRADTVSRAREVSRGFWSEEVGP